MVHIPYMPRKDSRRKYIIKLIMFAPVGVGLWLFSFLLFHLTTIF